MALNGSLREGRFKKGKRDCLPVMPKKVYVRTLSRNRKGFMSELNKIMLEEAKMNADEGLY